MRRRATEFWIVAEELPAATPDGFYRRVNETLEKIDFAAAGMGDLHDLPMLKQQGRSSRD